jgi:hypothetical protein
MNRKRALIGALLVALLAAVVAVPGVQLAGGMTERLSNGGFEEGFYATPVGYVGAGWGWFQNGGQATYGFYDETWAPVIYEGEHSQLIEINTFCRGGSDPDRYAGIYQTVAVVPGEVYELSLHGMLRALADDPDRGNYSYRVQYGVDYDGGSDWTAVDNWVEVPWDTVHPRLTPGSMESYSTSITAKGEYLTLFVRVWKKWGTASRELDVNLDAISLKGALPSSTTKPKVTFAVPDYPVVGWRYTIPVKSSSEVGIISLELWADGKTLDWVDYDVGQLEVSHDFTWTPATAGSHRLKAIVVDTNGVTTYEAKVMVGEEGQFLSNGGFEEGFGAIPFGMVGKEWGWFHNSGQAEYGFYDETWAPVIHKGEHSQMIEVNTLGRAAADADRYAGIYQAVEGLTKGATYKLSLYGMLRARTSDDLSGYNYRVEWGYDPSGGTDWTAVDNWVEIPWDTIYPRLAPGTMSGYTAEFEAPSGKITLFIRVWKKWGTVNRELDVNLDSIMLSGYK